MVQDNTGQKPIVIKDDMINHPRHYCMGGGNVKVECIDIARHLSFSRGNAFKYIWRYGEKGDDANALEDLEKALWYVDDCLVHYPQEDVGWARAIFKLLPASKEFKYMALAMLLSDIEGAQEFIGRKMTELKTMVHDHEKSKNKTNLE